MPRLDVDSPALQRLRTKHWEITKQLPDTRDVYERSQGIITTEYLGAEYAMDAAMLYQQASQMSLGAVASNIGMPILRVFQQTMDVLDVDVVAQVTEVLVQLKGSVQNAIDAAKSAGDAAEGGEAMAAAVSTGVGVAVDSVAMVPIAGWIVKAAWEVGKFVRTIVSLAKQAKGYGHVETIYPDTRFSPWLNTQIVNEVIEDLRLSQDWSHRFGPPALGQGQGTLPDYWLKETESGAREITRVTGYDSDGHPHDWQSAGWTGFVPGSSYLLRGVRIEGEAGVSLIGPDLLPSAQQILLWVWSTVIGRKGHANPAMYCVDADAVLTWNEWIHGLHAFVYDTGGLSTAQKEAVMRGLNKDPAGNKLLGWGTSVKPKEGEWDKYVPIKQANALLDRQQSFLDTLLVAYVDDNFAAIKNNRRLRDKWEQRRRDLLGHPARCDVDLDNVPDGDYRRELIARGAGSVACYAAKLGYTARTFPKDLGGSVEDANPYGSAPRRRSGGGIGLVPFLALGAGAYWAWRKGYFKGLPLIG